MRTAARIIVRIVLIVILLAIGFAAGFPVGREAGFMTGSEWAIVQAEIVAREAGRSMPVTLEDGQLHLVVKQPDDLYRRARQREARSGAAVRIVRTDGQESGEGQEKDN